MPEFTFANRKENSLDVKLSGFTRGGNPKVSYTKGFVCQEVLSPLVNRYH